MSKNKNWFYITGIIAAVLICYFKVFGAGINNWDDAEYVFANPDIRSFSLENISRWFSRYYIGNYHPLTMVSYALDWQLGHDNPFFYHLTNILLHIVNAILIFTLTFRWLKHREIAFFVALIFAVHPVQTESVSWIAERKNVLYATFFLGSLLAYTSFLSSHKRYLYAAAVLLGLCSMLSKAAALALPFALVAIDMFLGRRLQDKKLWAEKIPFLVFALILGIVGIQAQDVGGFLNWHQGVTFPEKVALAGYAYTSYITTIFAPFNLSVWYPYPDKLQLLHFGAILLAAGIVALGVFAYLRKHYILAGSILFFSANIFLVLQIVQFGESLRADRYLYLPCLGIILPAVYYPLTLKKEQLRKPLLFVFATLTGLLILATFHRNDIWLSERNFWGAVLDRFPNSAVAQYSMAAAYLNEGDYINAEPHINAAIAAEPRNHKAWYNKGVLHLRQNRLQDALEALNQSLSIQSYSKALFTRALVYQQLDQPALAMKDAAAVLETEPDNPRAHYILADALEQQQQLAQALEHYNTAITLQSKEPLFYMRRAVATAKLGNFSAAFQDLSTAMELEPRNGAHWYWRAMIQTKINQNPCPDLQHAARLGFPAATQALAEFCK